MPRLACAIRDQQRISNLKCVASLFPKARRAQKIKKDHLILTFLAVLVWVGL